MSYINPTVWNDIQSTNASNEKRFAELGIINTVKASTAGVDYILPSEKQALSELSSLRDIQIPVIKDQTVQVVTSPSFNIPHNLAETANYSFQTYDVFSGFRFYPASFANNQLDAITYRNSVANNVAYGMGNTIEGILSTQLEARKTQKLDFLTEISQGDGTYSFASNTLSVNKAAQKETMFNYLEQLMAANELGGNYSIVTNRAGLAVQKAEFAKFGASNDKNLQALGMISPERMRESGNLATASGQNFSGFLVRDGAMGVYENFPYDFRNGTVIGGKKWSVSDVALPYIGMKCNIYTNSEATDATALISAGADSNLKMSHFEEMAMWARFTVVYRYNSDLATRANDIVKIVGTTS